MMKNPFEAAAICIANLAFAFAFYNIFCRLLDQGIREMDRKQKLRRILCYPVFYISNTFLGLAHIHGLRKAAVFLLSLFLCALIGHRGRMENKVSICLTSGGYALLVEMLSGYLAAFVFRIVPGDLLNRELHGVFVMVISRGLLLGSSFGVSAVAARLETANTVKYVGTLLMMPLCSIIIIVCVVMDNVAEMRFVDYLHDYVLTVSLILMLFTNVGLLFLLNRIYRQSIDRSKIQHLKQQRQLYMETMEIQKQSQSEMEKYRHDVKNLYPYHKSFLHILEKVNQPFQGQLLCSRTQMKKHSMQIFCSWFFRLLYYFGRAYSRYYCILVVSENSALRF